MLQHKCYVHAYSSVAWMLWYACGAITVWNLQSEYCDINYILMITIAAQMRWYKWMLQSECGNVRRPGGGMLTSWSHNLSSTINNVGIVLDKALVHSLVQSVACCCPCWGVCFCPCRGFARFTFSMTVQNKIGGLTLSESKVLTLDRCLVLFGTHWWCL